MALPLQLVVPAASSSVMDGIRILCGLSAAFLWLLWLPSRPNSPVVGPRRSSSLGRNCPRLLLLHTVAVIARTMAASYGSVSGGPLLGQFGDRDGRVGVSADSTPSNVVTDVLAGYGEARPSWRLQLRLRDEAASASLVLTAGRRSASEGRMQTLCPQRCSIGSPPALWCEGVLTS